MYLQHRFRHYITTLFLLSIFASPMIAQNAVPPTARQAAKMSAFASRLARPAQSKSPMAQSTSQRRLHPLASPACILRRGGSPFDDTMIYNNGPTNGTTNAWTINFGSVVSNSFTVPSNGSTINAMTFAAWLLPGDVTQTVEISITSDEFGGTTYFDQTVSIVQSGCVSNQYGYNVCLETGSIVNGPNLNAGTYWVNLQNASANTGDPVYWDENSGPSLASENSIGTIPSESFSILGPPGPPPPPPPPPPSCSSVLPVVHDFSPGEGFPNGVTMDNAGNLYGPASGGTYGAGMIYKMTPKNQDWLFTPLYSFTGGSDGSGPSPVILGPNGIIYGAAGGGIQSCGQDGSSYCGVIFSVRPSQLACPAVLCSWRENVLYRFAGADDGWAPVNLTIDQAGNIYGTVSLSGNRTGVFELSHSAGGWTERIIYTFNGGYSTNVTSLIAGKDGNLYGTTPSDGDWISGTVFQLVPSDTGWTKNVVYAFHGQDDGYLPRELHQDNSGNLYGVSWFFADICYYESLVFKLSHTGNEWVFEVQEQVDYGRNDNAINSFTTDAGGNYYFTFVHWLYGDIYDWSAVMGSGGTYWSDNAWFNPNGPITIDANHVYGTTPDCGAYGSGTLWSVTH